MTDPNKAAWLNRQNAGPSYSDGLIPTPGVPGSAPPVPGSSPTVVIPEAASATSNPTLSDVNVDDGTETAAILDDPETMAAIAEGEADLAAGNVEEMETFGEEEPTPAPVKTAATRKPAARRRKGK